jgi:hypothetical protein
LWEAKSWIREYYSTFKKGNVVFLTAQMNLEEFMLSEIGRHRKQTLTGSHFREKATCFQKKKEKKVREQKGKEQLPAFQNPVV